ncbi:MAG: hypothetical protein JZU64_13595 [Rhodoferax sp.]|nr:hypothetical protein [Rhodoferax sp.]
MPVTGYHLKMTTFNVSKPLTFGIEMELQIIKEADGLLSPSCQGLMAQLPQATRRLFMPEATQSTIEFVSTVHSDVDDMLIEAFEHLSVLKQTATSMQLSLRGGGNHAMHFWTDRIMSATARGDILQKNTASCRNGFPPTGFMCMSACQVPTRLSRSAMCCKN